jgi:Succinate dehydrogenase/fumarate reductase, flavoprotein subunit
VVLEPPKYPGIPPIATYSFDGWTLPGHGDPYDDCGIFWKAKGCLDVEAHNQVRLDGVDVVGKVFVKTKHRSCLRPQCPVCYEKWAGRGAGRIETRINQYKGSGKPIHVMGSVPHDLYHLPMADLRRRSQILVREVGFFGGSCIVHPFREHCVSCHEPKDTQTKRCPNCGCKDFSWYFSPHFHFIGYGWIQGKKVAHVYHRTGWVVKNLGVRDSVGATALYQLSHAGVHGRHDTVSWFGSMSRRKMTTIPEERKKETCPLCGADLVDLLWVGEGELPFTEEGEYFDSPANWVGSLGWRGGG